MTQNNYDLDIEQALRMANSQNNEKKLSKKKEDSLKLRKEI